MDLPYSGPQAPDTINLFLDGFYLGAPPPDAGVYYFHDYTYLPGSNPDPPPEFGDAPAPEPSSALILLGLGLSALAVRKKSPK